MGSLIVVIDQNELVGPKKTSWHYETTNYWRYVYVLTF